MPTPILIALLCTLAVHYILAVATIYLLLKDKLTKDGKATVALIVWNIVILFLPIIGPVVYLIYRQTAKKN